MYRCINRLAPNYLCDGLDYYAAKHDYNTRNSYRACLYLAKTNTECFKNSFVYNGSKFWNDIPHVIRDVPTLFVCIILYAIGIIYSYFSFFFLFMWLSNAFAL